jgi:hypothetical protein
MKVSKWFLMNKAERLIIQNTLLLIKTQQVMKYHIN